MNIRLIISDVDGVWTDGKIIYSSDGRETKAFNVRDGLGVKIAQKAGIEVAIVTSRHSDALTRRCQELGICEVVQGAGDKLDEVLRLATKLTIPIEEICYIGDDLPDLAPMMTVGLSAAPADAAPEVFQIAKRKLATAGGEGAFRELVETILKERGDWGRIVNDFYAAKITSQNV